MLACGQTARVSHDSAAYLYGLLPYPAEPRPRSTSPSPSATAAAVAASIVHRTTALARTRVPRARRRPGDRPDPHADRLRRERRRGGARAAVAEAFARASSAADRSCAKLDRVGAAPAPSLRRLLEGAAAAHALGTGAEAARLIRAAGLPSRRPMCASGLGGRLLWRERLSRGRRYAAHSSPWAFERDRRRRRRCRLSATSSWSHRLARSPTTGQVVGGRARALGPTAGDRLPTRTTATR